MRTLQLVVQPSTLTWAVYEGGARDSSGAVKLPKSDRERGAAVCRLVRDLIEDRVDAIGYRTTRYPYIGKNERAKFAHLEDTIPVVFLLRWQAARAGVPIREVIVTRAEAGGKEPELCFPVMVRKLEERLREMNERVEEVPENIEAEPKTPPLGSHGYGDEVPF